VRDVRESFAVKNRFPEDFIYKVLDVADNEEQNLIVNFTSCVCHTVLLSRP
jgi:hypothetical protein